VGVERGTEYLKKKKSVTGRGRILPNKGGGWARMADMKRKGGNPSVPRGN